MHNHVFAAVFSLLGTYNASTPDSWMLVIDCYYCEALLRSTPRLIAMQAEQDLAEGRKFPDHPDHVGHTTGVMRQTALVDAHFYEYSRSQSDSMHIVYGQGELLLHNHKAS